MSRILTVTTIMIGLLLPYQHAIAQSQERTLSLYADPHLRDGGIIDYLLPRFRFKTRIGTIIAETVDEAQLLLITETDALQWPDAAYHQPLIRDAETEIVFSLVIPAAHTEALAFSGWLQSPAGERAVDGHQQQGQTVFLRYEAPEVESREVEEAVMDAALVQGRKLAFYHCGRCHVIDESNKYGGIGSTPSFAAMRNLTDWREKFDAFWTLNPHPSFTQVEGMTEPFPIERPPHIAPIELTLDEVEAIVAFTGTLAPKDLGANVQSQ